MSEGGERKGARTLGRRREQVDGNLEVCPANVFVLVSVNVNLNLRWNVSVNMAGVDPGGGDDGRQRSRPSWVARTDRDESCWTQRRVE